VLPQPVFEHALIDPAQRAGALGASAIRIRFSIQLKGKSGRYAVLTQLGSQQPRPAWAECLPLLDPVASERLVVYKAAAAQPLQHRLDVLGCEARARQAATHLGLGSRSRRQEAQRRVDGVRT
jgi:hypothetical protein